MSRIKSIQFTDNPSGVKDDLRSLKYILTDDTELTKDLESVSFEIDCSDSVDKEISCSNVIVKSITLSRNLNHVIAVRFKGCVFPNKLDLNFHEVDFPIVFKDCVFLDDVCLFGIFHNTVSFTESSFIGSYVNFQECCFESFTFNITTLTDSKLCFQQTEFWTPNIHLNDMHLINSTVDFANSDFDKPSSLLDMLCVKADESSSIRFIMVDFDFDEFRLWHSEIECLKFLECTFNCRRFEFDCSIKTLIIQKCVNNGAMHLGAIKELRDFNITNFINRGAVSIGTNPQIFIDAIKTDADVIWVKGHEYRPPSHVEKNDQIHAIGELYFSGQLKKTEPLCFGAYAEKLRAVMQSPYDEQGSLTYLLLRFITEQENVKNRFGDAINISDKMASELFKFKADVRKEIRNRASQPDMVNIAYSYFEKDVVPCVKEKLLGNLCNDIKNLVLNDDEAMSNGGLLNNAESDNLATFLADVFLYAIQKSNKRSG